MYEMDAYSTFKFSNVIEHVIFAGLELFTPKKSKSSNKSHKCWSKQTLELKMLRKKKLGEMRKLARKGRQEEAKSCMHQIKSLGKSIQNSIRNDVFRQENRVLSAQNDKVFFQFVNSQLKSKKSDPPIKNMNGDLISDSFVKANIFNDFFASVFIDDNGSVPKTPHVNHKNHISEIVFSPDMVLEAIKKLKPSSSYGPDKVPNLILKRCANELSGPLATLFNFSFQESVLPNSWKSAHVRPLFKNNGDPSDCSNYRPISLTSCICKVMEKIVKSEIVNFCEANHIFPVEQHGFREKYSTVTQILKFCNQITKTVDAKNVRQVDAIYLDFQKAFDKVSHPKLLAKLGNLGISGKLFLWIKSFIIDRSQKVRFENAFSDEKRVSSGVPQGTVLAPLLFILFLHDIPETCKFGSLKLFADDITMFSEIKCTSDKLKLQSDLDSLVDYTKKWQLSLSIEKCHSMNFGKKVDAEFLYQIDGKYLNVKNWCKDLGLFLQSSMKPSLHCQSIANKARSRACLIMKCFVTRDNDFLTKMFNVYVRPILEYGCPVWSPWLLKDIDTIESVQRAFTKRYPKLWSLSYTERLSLLDLDSLELRRLRFDIMTCFKILNNMLPLEINDFFTMSGLNTRQKLTKADGRCDERLYFFSNRIVPVYNSLPHEITDIKDFKCFKSMLASYESSSVDNPLSRFLRGRALK